MLKSRLDTVIVDCETDDLESEAPSKHRFCLINARRAGFDEQANI